MTKSNIEYSFYFNVFNNGNAGTIPAESFGLFIAKAWREVESMMTSDYAEEQSDIVKCCVCEVAEELCKNAEKQGIKSESTDGYSVTYAGSESLKKTIKNIIVRRLGNTGLLYMGVDGC